MGTPVLSILIYLGSYYLTGRFIHLNVAGQTAWFLRLIWGDSFDVAFTGVRYVILVPGRYSIGFTHFCSGFQATAIFAGVILTVPHSKDPAGTYEFELKGASWTFQKAHPNIWVRKLKSLALSSFLFHVVNVVRMIIQLSLYYVGYAWEDIHYSISAASSFIAAVIILLMHRWLPEFVFAIIFIGAEAKKKLAGGSSRKEAGSGVEGALAAEAAKEAAKEAAMEAPMEADRVEKNLGRREVGYWRKFWSLVVVHHGSGVAPPAEPEDKRFAEFAGEKDVPLMIECAPTGRVRKFPYVFACTTCGAPVAFEDAFLGKDGTVACPTCQEGSRGESGNGKGKVLAACWLMYGGAAGLLVALLAYFTHASTLLITFAESMAIATLTGALALVAIALALGPRGLLTRLSVQSALKFLEKTKPDGD
ncbi:MAG: hypothetical protein Kow0069_38860 [Promethearchaeota archaeon]